MATRIKFFHDAEQVQEARRFFNTRGIKNFVRERSRVPLVAGEEPFGFDLFILRAEDVDEARKLLDYEYGNEWGETIRGH